MKSLELLKAEKILEIGMIDAERYLEFRLGNCTKEQFIEFAQIGNHTSTWNDYLKNQVTYDRFEFDIAKSLNRNLLNLMNNQFYCFYDIDAISENVWPQNFTKREWTNEQNYLNHTKQMEDDFDGLMLRERELFRDLKSRILTKLGRQIRTEISRSRVIASKI